MSHLKFDPISEDSKDNPDLIEYAPRTVDGQATEESIIYDWHKLDAFMTTENRRLLPDTPNAVHIIDGPGNRYKRYRNNWDNWNFDKPSNPLNFIDII